MVESSDDAIISMNFDGIITTWNAGEERLYCYSAEQIIAKPISIPNHLLAAVLKKVVSRGPVRSS